MWGSKAAGLLVDSFAFWPPLPWEKNIRFLLQGRLRRDGIKVMSTVDKSSAPEGVGDLSA
jgi:hypothetical protein